MCTCTYKLPKHGKGYNIQKGDRSTDLSRVRKTVMFNEVTTSWGKWFHGSQDTRMTSDGIRPSRFGEKTLKR